jgi:hypothetical protein
MKSSHKLAAGFIAFAGFALAAAAVYAHPEGMEESMGDGAMRHGGMGPGGMAGGPMGGRMQHDEAFAADMRLVHEMLSYNDRIQRTVMNLPNGIRTVTESGDAQVAQYIKAHVASMEKRLDEGRVFNLFSNTLPVLFEKKDKIRTKVETTGNGIIVIQTSDDAEVVAALQAHAVEVSELARDGMAAMMRGMRAKMMGSAHRQ